MRVEIRPDAAEATEAASEALVDALNGEGMRTFMAAGGNTPLELYRSVAPRPFPRDVLDVFTLDDYVGVPPHDARTVGNLVRRAVVEAWGLRPSRFHALSSMEGEAEASVQRHERALASKGGLDLLVLGLGRNGHLGFNEPGSAPDSTGRLVDLEPVSIQANREWFAGEHAPRKGVTCGLKTLLSAKRILMLAFGEEKAQAVAGMVQGPRRAECPASWLQGHPDVRVFLDRSSARLLKSMGAVHER